MKPLKISHSAVTSKALLRMADSIPGAWIGIRIAGLLLLLSGWKSTAVRRLFGLSRQAVVDWVGKANRQGLNSIYDVARSGRPTRLDRVAQGKLEKALAKSPEQFGLPRSRWDGVVVVEFLRKECNVELKPRQARNWLKRLGFVLKRPVHRYIQASNIVEQSEKALLVFADESGFSLHPKLGRVWAKRGSQPTVATTSHHGKRLNLFGWVEPLKGWHGLFRWPKGNTDGFLAFLKYLCYRVQKTKVYLYIDGASWHRGPRVRKFLNAHTNIQVEYLPPYHPELNVQERVWHLIRYEATTNQYHATVDMIEHAIRKRQRHWRTKKIKTLC